MKCISPIYVKPNVVPCGKCNYCRQLRMLDWSFRLRNEMRYADTAYFVTLTLRFAPQQGVSKRHLQLFFKRLRTHIHRHSPGEPGTRKKVVYFAVAEYGERTLRPHYHAIIYNADVESISRAWKLGRIHIGSVSDESIAYVANYSLKGSRYPRGSRKPFSLMSRRPAIGYRYLETHIGWHRGGQAITSGADVESFKSYTMVNGRRGHLPRFYRDKMFTDKERKLLTAIAMSSMDDSFRKEVDRLVSTRAYTESTAFNYILERHLFHHEQLVKNFEKHESI